MKEDGAAMRVAITGGSGFIGAAVVDRLSKRGARVACFQRRPGPAGAESRALDLGEAVRAPATFTAALLEFQPDVVVHLAWGHATNTRRDDPRHYSENLRFTQILVDLLADALPACHFVGVGSQAEYGVKERPLTPEEPCDPSNAYGRAKYLAGRYAVWRLGERAAWLRLLTAYGPDDDPNKLIPYLVRSYRSGIAPALSPGDQRWDWLHVDDAAAAIVATAERGAGGIHVLASGETATIAEIARSLHTLAQARGWPAPPPRLGGRPYNPRELFLLAGDATSLRIATGWAPEVPLARGLATVLEATGPERMR